MRPDVDLTEQYQPHWFWALCFFLVPLTLTALGFLGLYPQDVVPLRVASLAPRVAVLVSLIGFGAAAVRWRRLPLAITGMGVAVTVSGFLLLMWLT